MKARYNHRWRQWQRDAPYMPMIVNHIVKPSFRMRGYPVRPIPVPQVELTMTRGAEKVGVWQRFRIWLKK